MRWVALLLLSFIPVAASADDAALWQLLQGSLFLDSAEQTANAARLPGALPQAQNLRVGGIVLLGPEQWQVWINGQPITPTNNNGSIQVIAISPHKVRLRWQPEGQPLRLLELGAHQTYIAATGTTIEGSTP